jgi:Zn-dependent peptidase ImmA (M78 family)
MGGAVTKQAIFKYERGTAQPSPRVLMLLARALKVKSACLWAAPPVTVEFLAYRKAAALGVRQLERVKSEVTQAMEARARLQEINGETNGSNIPIRSLRVDNIDEAEMAAMKLREEWQLGQDPIACLTDLLEEHFVQVIPIEAPPKFDGLSAVSRDEKGKAIAAAVVTRKDVTQARQRFNLAHELGHLVMDVPGRVDEEKAAHRFAGAFLAPGDALKRRVGSHRTSITFDELVMLKRGFGMSIQALLYRLKDLQVISHTCFTQWNIEVRASHLNRNEPGELPPEEGQWFRRSVLRALAEGRLSSDEAEGLLGEAPRKEPPLSLTERRAFMRLPMEERRKLLAEQAAKLAAHYDDDNDNERSLLHGGNVLDY